MVQIITDSAADFELAELEKMNVACIPLSVSFGDGEYQENIDITKEQFYRLLEAKKEFPHTSQPPPYAFGRVLGKMKEQGDGAVVITMSSALSGTYQGAVMAKDFLGYDDCHIVDSRIATGGEQILVEEAVRLRAIGKSAGEIAESLEKLRTRIVLYTCMDTLEYLYRGGRISQSAFTIGSAVKIKPILHVSPEGKAEIPAKMLGMRRGMDYLLKRVEEQQPDPAYPFYIMYTKESGSGLALMEYLKKHGVRVTEDRMVSVGAVVGTHIGPNACGIVYIRR